MVREIDSKQVNKWQMIFPLRAGMELESDWWEEDSHGSTPAVLSREASLRPHLSLAAPAVDSFCLSLQASHSLTQGPLSPALLLEVMPVRLTAPWRQGLCLYCSLVDGRFKWGLMRSILESSLTVASVCWWAEGEGESRGRWSAGGCCSNPDKIGLRLGLYKSKHLY